MALSKKDREYLVVAISNKKIANEIADQIDAGSAKASFVAPVSAANANDLASAETLANATKVTVNAIQASLIAAGIMKSS